MKAEGAVSGTDSATPETKITADLALRVYQKILAQVGRQADAPSWQGVTAHTDPDGYGVTLTDGIVSIRVLFHNRVAIQSPSSRALMRFRKRLAAIDSRTSSGC
jgi:hypothetical protein